jgi:hypothetical protein
MRFSQLAAFKHVRGRNRPSAASRTNNEKGGNERKSFQFGMNAQEKFLVFNKPLATIEAARICGQTRQVRGRIPTMERSHS